jgi:electron transport complex protein RnfC
LAAAEKALHDYQQANADPATTSAVEPADAAQIAIERAMAARQAEADRSPQEKAQDNLQKLEARLAKSEARLNEGRAAGEEEKIIIALESTVERLQEKVAAARAQLRDTETC